MYVFILLSQSSFSFPGRNQPAARESESESRQSGEREIGSLRSGGRLCTLIGVPWRGVSFSTLSTGRFVIKQYICNGAESAEHAETQGTPMRAHLQLPDTYRYRAFRIFSKAKHIYNNISN